QCEYSVEALAKLMDLSVANTSHHLQQLRQVGLVRSRKCGQRVFYQRNGSEVFELIISLRTVTEKHDGELSQLVANYLSNKDTLEPISRDGLMKRAKQGSVMIIDVRPPAEFNAGHLPKAVNIEMADLINQIDGLGKEQEIIAYCRGPYCVLAFEAVKFLRVNGFQVRRLEGGYPEWEHAGLPIERAVN
ncbi:MAG: ArsR family transcriptional regulator, partial [Cycloclasticus sp.]|nr:ArsR family transcriptional regulator [Cycloclasticus sp.]MBQ0789373.1 ArsR family transcriptional regulator [Cycloclasticus sp.]